MKPPILVLFLFFFVQLVQGQQITLPNGLNSTQKDSLYEVMRRQNPLPAEPPSFNKSINPIPLPACFEPFDNTGGNGWVALPRNDDGSVGPIALGWDFSLFGTIYNSVYINNNGNITFLNPVSQYNPDGFPITTPMIAAFWSDIDTRSNASGLVWYKLFPNRLVVTWDRVGYFSYNTDKVNTFQLTIKANTAPGFTGNDVVFAYGDMQFTTGDVSGGSSGFGGNEATVGANRGANNDFIQTGRFSVTGSTPPLVGTTGGVDWLDGKCIGYQVRSGIGNLPPAIAGLPANNLFTVNQGTTRVLPLQFSGPETNQRVQLSVNLGNLCSTSALISGNNTTNPSVSLVVSGTACNTGTNPVIITATDSGTPSLSQSFTINVLVTCPSCEVVMSQPLRLGGGLGTLDVGTSYGLTGGIRNQGSNTWTGNILLQVGSGSLLTLASNVTLTPGSSFTLNPALLRLTPTSSQTGTHPISLLMQTGVAPSELVRTLNTGIVNPIRVTIVQSQTALNRQAAIMPANGNVTVRPGELLSILGKQFSPGASVTLTAQTTQVTLTVGGDGAFLTSLSVPSAYNQPLLTVSARDNRGQFVQCVVSINVTLSATLILTDPTTALVSDGYIFVGNGEGALPIAWTDILRAGPDFLLNGVRRQCRYQVSFEYASTGQLVPLFVVNDYRPMDVLQNFQRDLFKTELATALGTSLNPTATGRIQIVDMLDTSRPPARSDVLTLYWGERADNLQIEKKWDKSAPDPGVPIRAIAADGTGRFYWRIGKASTAGAAIERVEIKLSDASSPASVDPTWLGRVMLATTQSNAAYSSEANGISTISAQSSQTTVDGQYWFWYVAPDNFQEPGKPYDDRSERTVYVTFKVYQRGNNTPIERTESITIIRPPLMLVHGLASDASAWDNFMLTNGGLPNSNLFRNNVYRVNMLPNMSFDVNAVGILKGTSIGEENSFGGILANFRSRGYVGNQVDYLCHSMGGSVLRRAVDAYSSLFYGTGFQANRMTYKNYERGFVHKVVTINTPHGGSPWADLINGLVPVIPSYSFHKTLTEAYLLATAFENQSPAYRYISSFIQPEFSSMNCSDLNLFCTYDFEGSPAVKNLQVIGGNGGIDFKEFPLPTHVITSDFIPGLTPIPNFENTLLDIENLNTQVQFLYTIFSFLNEKSESLLPAPLGDVADKLKEILPPALLRANKVLSAPEKVLFVLKATEAFLLVAVRYNNWWDGDLIVPLVSQQAGLSSTSQQVSYFSDNNLFEAMWRYNHIKVTDQQPIAQQVKFLLNQKVGSVYFGPLPSNQRPTYNKTNDQKSNVIAGGYAERFDRNGITITSPGRTSTALIGQTLPVRVAVRDSVHLQSISLYFQNQQLSDTLRRKSANFSMVVEPGRLQREVILAKARYVRGDSIVCLIDTLTVALQTTESLVGFSVRPAHPSIPIGTSLKPSYALRYPSFWTAQLDPARLSVTVANTAAVSYSPRNGQLMGLRKGESIVYFQYGSLRDTVYVTVGSGGNMLPHLIQTGSLSQTATCAGSVITVSFSTTGGVFDTTNEFSAQLVDVLTDTYLGLPGSTTSSPLSFTLPTNLPIGGLYQVRVLSANPAILGSLSSQTLLISGAFPTATLTGSQTIASGQTATLTTTLSGSRPWSLTLSNGQSFSGVVASPFAFTVAPANTATYTLTRVANACGTGTVSGSATVTVNGSPPCLSMYSVRTGNWNDPVTWSCNRVPVSTDVVKVSSGHTVTIPAGSTALALTLQDYGRLVYGTGARLRLGATTDLTTGLVAYYPFNSNANDGSGNANNGTVSGATLVADRNGTANSAYRFADGNSINVANSTSLQFNNAQTFAGWVKLRSYAGRDGNGALVAKGVHTVFSRYCDQGHQVCRFDIDAQNNINFSIVTGATFHTINFPYTLDTWVHIASVYDGTMLRLYVNGVLAGAKTTTLTFGVSNSSVLNIGKMGCWSYFFNGDLDELRFYNRAMTDAEVQALAAQ